MEESASPLCTVALGRERHVTVNLGLGENGEEILTKGMPHTCRFCEVQGHDHVLFRSPLMIVLVPRGMGMAGTIPPTLTEVTLLLLFPLPLRPTSTMTTRG